MAEEFRFFLRVAGYVAVAGVVYWLVSYEPAGTVLLLALILAIATFIGIGLALARGRARSDGPRGGGPLGWVNRFIGFHERADEPAPLEGGPEIVPLSSSWPVVTAAAMVVAGLGLIFGPWLLVPGLVLLAIGGIGWLTQLDGIEREI
jgi:hypothetical protein